MQAELKIKRRAMDEIVDLITRLNEQNICTRGVGTFGCACSKCTAEMESLVDDILKEPIPLKEGEVVKFPDQLIPRIRRSVTSVNNPSTKASSTSTQQNQTASNRRVKRAISPIRERTTRNTKHGTTPSELPAVSETSNISSGIC